MDEQRTSDQKLPSITIRPPSFQRRYLAAETEDPDTLVALATDESYFVRRQAVNNPNTPKWIIDLLMCAGASRDLRGKGEIDPELEADSLKRLAETGPWAQQLVAEHPNVSTEVLAALRDQPSASLRLAIAAHPHAGAATLAALCCDIEDQIRVKALANPNRPADLVDLLRAAGSSPDLIGVRDSFGEVTVDDFRLLFRLGPWGRYIIARHPACPEELLSQISSDPEWRVRSGLLDNPNTPIRLIKRMLDLPTSEEVEAIQSLSQPQISDGNLHHLVDHPSPEVRYALARHPTATPAVLDMLVTDGVKEIRCLAAAHPKTDPDVIERLVQAGSSSDLMSLREPAGNMPFDEIRALLRGGVWARQLAVRHPKTNADTLARLLCDREPKIREWAAVHPNLDPGTKDDLIRAGSGTDFQGFMLPDPTLPPDRLDEIGRLGSWGEWVVANNPYVPASVLDELANSNDWQVRLFVAKNPGTSAATLARLMNDLVVDVRKATAGRIST